MKSKSILLVVLILLGLFGVSRLIFRNTAEATYPAIDFMADFKFPGNWGNIPATELTLFYPGQASWQWLTSSDHPGAAGVNGGTACTSCHSGQEQKLGESLVKGDNKFGLEPNPIAGKEPYKTVKAQAAYDATNFYLKLEWESERPGITHQTYRFDGEKWVRNSKPKPDQLGENEIYSYEDRFSVILSDTNIPAFDGANYGFDQAGCWQTCHSSMRQMPKHPTSAEAQAALNQNDVRKYLLITREADAAQNDSGGWDQLKPKEQIDQLLAEGKFLDLWQFRGARSASVNKASDDYVLEYRFSGIGGKNAWFDQDATDGQFTAENWMYDKNEVGFNAFPADKFDEWIVRFPLITEGPNKNAVPFDPSAEFNVGDLIPRQALREPTESRANVSAYSNWENDKWTAIFVRALDTGNPDDKALVEGETYGIGFGLFDDFVSNRRHYVNLPMTLGIGVDADVKAVKIN